MSISATVRYNEDHERTGINVDAKGVVGMTAHFNMDGGTAVLTSASRKKNPADEPDLYADNLSYIMDYVGELPFVQAVTLDEYEPPEAEA